MGAERRRLAVVLASERAAAPPGVDPIAYAAAALADVYEVLADLAGVVAGIAGDPDAADLLWPGSRLFPKATAVTQLASIEGFDELLVVPADVPDLPGLVPAKVFQALGRADLVTAPERGGPGLAALGLRLPLPDWLRGRALDLDGPPSPPPPGVPRRAVATVPGWHRLRTPAAVERLDPGLEGWEQTRALLSGLHPGVG